MKDNYAEAKRYNGFFRDWFAQLGKPGHDIDDVCSLFKVTIEGISDQDLRDTKYLRILTDRSGYTPQEAQMFFTCYMNAIAKLEEEQMRKNKK